MNTISLRLYPETEALYKRLLDECDAGTNGKPATADQFINYLLECAQNPRKIEVSKTEDVTKINLLNESLEKLHTLVTEQEATITQLQTENTRLLNESGVIPAGSILFNVSESEQAEIENLKPWLISKGHEGTSNEALYVLIKQGVIKR